MAAGAGESESQGMERLLSCADDLLGVFRVSTDRDGNAKVGAGARRLVSACRSESDDLELQIKVVNDELDDLAHQRFSIEERTDAVKKKKKDTQKTKCLLSMCMSVTNIVPNLEDQDKVPNLEDQDKVSGNIIDQNRRKLENFEFENTTPPVEICNKLWKKI